MATRRPSAAATEAMRRRSVIGALYRRIRAAFQPANVPLPAKFNDWGGLVGGAGAEPGIEPAGGRGNAHQAQCGIGQIDVTEGIGGGEEGMEQAVVVAMAGAAGADRAKQGRA